MSRIRSIHPGLWTDDNFVSLSLAARLFLIGMWNEADDYGLFEWKPLRLKMRLFPADNFDGAAILEELASAGFLLRLVRVGKDYGVVKNFRKYQRPQKPTAPIIGLDAEIQNIIGLTKGDLRFVDHSTTPTVPVSEPSRNPPVSSSLMEDVGGNRNSNPPLPITAEGADEGDTEEGEELFKKVWEGFPRRLAESEPKCREAFAGLCLAEKRHFAGSIGAIRAYVSAEKTTNKRSLVTFTIDRLFTGFSASTGAVGRAKITIRQETDQFKAWDSYLRQTTGKSAPVANGQWYFDSEWPPPVEAEGTAA